MRTLKAVTLNTIPALRAIANDVILDVLLYLTPNYCYDVLESVTDQITALYKVVNKVYPDFTASGGKCSIIGHSLGSVICWDLLSLKKVAATQNTQTHDVHITNSSNADNVTAISYQQFSSQGVKIEVDDGQKIASSVASPCNLRSSSGTWGPSLPKPFGKVIPFEPDFTMFLGSPVGLFLTLRGAHAIFDSLRNAHPDKPVAAPFNLPTRALYNIYSPSDPVAYRIEPILLAEDTKELPEPEYLTRLGQDVRLHVKAMKLRNAISQSLSTSKQRSSFSLLMNSFSEHASSMLLQIDDTNTSNNVDRGSIAASAISDGNIRFPLAGRSGRLDYQLQPRVIDSEYISAVTAHSSYFQNSDVIDFVMDLVQRKEDVIDLTTDQTVTSIVDYELGRTTAS